MLVRLLVTFGLLFVSVHSAVTSSPKSSPSNAAILPKQAVSFEHDEAVTVEGSGEGANLDEYADDDENEQLSKVTATTMRISSTSTTTTTTKKTTTTMRAAEKKPTNGSKSTDLDANEFDEDYKDDLEDNVDYNEVTSAASSPSTTSTRPSPVPPRHNTPVRLFFGFLTRPPIAAGILAGSCPALRPHPAAISSL